MAVPGRPVRTKDNISEFVVVLINSLDCKPGPIAPSPSAPWHALQYSANTSTPNSELPTNGPERIKILIPWINSEIPENAPITTSPLMLFREMIVR